MCVDGCVVNDSKGFTAYLNAGFPRPLMYPFYMLSQADNKLDVDWRYRSLGGASARMLTQPDIEQPALHWRR